MIANRQTLVEQLSNDKDPIGILGSDSNLYRYAKNSPTIATDPTGLLAFPARCYKPCMTCGPEIGVGLELMLLNVRAYLKKLPSFQKRQAKANLVLSPSTASQWDISTLKALDRGALGICWPTRRGTVCETCVEVYGVKQDLWEVNYVLWGLMSAAIGLSHVEAVAIAALYKTWKWATEGESNPCRPQYQYNATVGGWIITGHQMYSPWFWDSPSGKFHALRTRENNDRFDSCDPCGLSVTSPFSYTLLKDLM